MMCFIELVGLSLYIGVIGVITCPSPYYAALSMALAAGVGCVTLVWYGGTLIGLMLFLIYLGGMLVVFAYSSALSGELYPDTWGEGMVKFYVLAYLVGLGIVGLWFKYVRGGWRAVMDEYSEFYVRPGDIGVGYVYYDGGAMLLVCGWALLLCLFAVLELTRGSKRGALRAV
uniref:NADH-ubiquinone oxidoreductase chain 6 n=2 Tax=Pseudexostoma TaxID=175783 RepID=A0A0R7FFH4_9TELE|nr:NADH dehydrogenase subunit 6 [Pseudexostoma yunnanense]AFH37614.1 NADH dehydrogenase subunit 6 [Pseudexostoma yunnanense]AKO72192.1 NADH dehydrogenase subunit 6 [Pseudexostoma brachysoma]